jgi:hypothetical protein
MAGFDQAWRAIAAAPVHPAMPTALHIEEGLAKRRVFGRGGYVKAENLDTVPTGRPCLSEGERAKLGRQREVRYVRGSMTVTDKTQQYCVRGRSGLLPPQFLDMALSEHFSRLSN